MLLFFNTSICSKVDPGKKKIIYLNSLHGRQVYESQWKSIQKETFLLPGFWKRCIDKVVNWFSMESFSVEFIIIQLYVFSVHCNFPLTSKLPTFYGALPKNNVNLQLSGSSCCISLISLA